MEIIDLYNKRKELIGKTIDRKSGEPEEGTYKLSVHVYILNSKGELLIQRRSENAKRNPKKWAFTGGMVDTKENSYEGAIREVEEELGRKYSKDDIELMLSFKREKGFVDVWLIHDDFKTNDCKLQKEEVSDAKWVSIKELEDMMKKDETVNSMKLYFELFKSLLKKCYNAKVD